MKKLIASLFCTFVVAETMFAVDAAAGRQADDDAHRLGGVTGRVVLRVRGAAADGDERREGARKMRGRFDTHALSP